MEAPPEHSLDQIAKCLGAARRIVVLAHVRPDGDAVGSVLGLYHSLRAMGKEVVPMLEDPVPEYLAFLPGADCIQAPTEPLDADLVVALDTATRERLGAQCLAVLEGVSDWVNIDHHPSNPGYGRLNHVDGHAPATGQLIYELLKGAGFPVTDEVRDNLFVAISTDTGSFQYSNTNARTHEVIAEMMRQGVDSAELSRLVYQRQPLRQVKLLGRMLAEMKLTERGRVASWAVTQEGLTAVSAVPGDTEGLIDSLRRIDDVVAAALFEEMEDGRIRVSTRSKSPKVDVSKVCSQFGGGGHRAAAGARMPPPMEQSAQRFLDALENEVRRFD